MRLCPPGAVWRLSTARKMIGFWPNEPLPVCDGWWVKYPPGYQSEVRHRGGSGWANIYLRWGQVELLWISLTYWKSTCHGMVPAEKHAMNSISHHQITKGGSPAHLAREVIVTLIVTLNQRLWINVTDVDSILVQRSTSQKCHVPSGWCNGYAERLSHKSPRIVLKMFLPRFLLAVKIKQQISQKTTDKTQWCVNPLPVVPEQRFSLFVLKDPYDPRAPHLVKFSQETESACLTKIILSKSTVKTL